MCLIFLWFDLNRLMERINFMGNKVKPSVSIYGLVEHLKLSLALQIEVVFSSPECMAWALTF